MTSTASFENAVAWLRRFETENGRRLRVLHVGNVAGNAYLNAKFLRAAGAECHVLSYDYYHPFGTPEWEDGVPRPDWFVQGPLPASSKYLLALLDDRRLAVSARRMLLDGWIPPASDGAKLAAKHVSPSVRSRTVAMLHGTRPLRLGFQRWLTLRHNKLAHRISWIWNWYLRTFWLRVLSALRKLDLHLHKDGLPAADAFGADAITPASSSDPRVQARIRIAEDFQTAFPSRTDALTFDEIEEWQYNLEYWEALVSRYDIVQGYGTDVIRPYVAGKRPYVGYEHGTLRDFTLGDDSTHRMTALAYREADHVFITNGDCLEYAQRLGIAHYSPMIHPIDVDKHRRELDFEITEIKARIAADIILFCPLRHDWAIKGTDVHLRALPMIKAAHPERKVVLLVCEWGAQIDDSKRLLAQLGCTDDVRWMPPLDRNDLVVYLRACDVVLDQIALPHFGATAPQALAAGTPVIMSYEPQSTEWIVDEPAPILQAFDPAGVVAAVAYALDTKWLAQFRRQAAHWVQAYHHPDRLVADHCHVYQRLLQGDRTV